MRKKHLHFAATLSVARGPAWRTSMARNCVILRLCTGTSDKCGYRCRLTLNSVHEYSTSVTIDHGFFWYFQIAQAPCTFLGDLRPRSVLGHPINSAERSSVAYTFNIVDSWWAAHTVSFLSPRRCLPPTPSSPLLWLILRACEYTSILQHVDSVVAPLTATSFQYHRE